MGLHTISMRIIIGVRIRRILDEFHVGVLVDLDYLQVVKTMVDCQAGGACPGALWGVTAVLTRVVLLQDTRTSWSFSPPPPKTGCQRPTDSPARAPAAGRRWAFTPDTT